MAKVVGSLKVALCTYVMWSKFENDPKKIADLRAITWFCQPCRPRTWATTIPWGHFVLRGKKVMTSRNSATFRELNNICCTFTTRTHSASLRSAEPWNELSSLGWTYSIILVISFGQLTLKPLIAQFTTFRIINQSTAGISCRLSKLLYLLRGKSVSKWFSFILYHYWYQ